jgi:hypothetical protein
VLRIRPGTGRSGPDVKITKLTCYLPFLCAESNDVYVCTVSGGSIFDEKIILIESTTGMCSIYCKITENGEKYF